MDIRNKTAREYQFIKKKDNPSFSSTLLDAICNSNDQSDCRREEADLSFYREAMRNRQSFDSRKEKESWKSRKLCTSHSLMEKNTNENVAVRRNSVADFDRKDENVRERDFKWVKWSSSSSESSAGGGVSSSECESFLAAQKLKPIKTAASVRAEKNSGEANISVPREKTTKATFPKTKSRASKIYDDLKKVKPPISPGSRLSSLLNSLFNGGSPKKPKFTSSNPATQENYPRNPKKTPCSASTFSMSCLSITPSSTGKPSKKTVTFFPLCMITGEEASRDEVSDGEEDEEEDDVVSCSSSDLFELDNLWGIGGGGSGRRQNEELPVYDTTRFGSNRIVSNGFVLQ